MDAGRKLLALDWTGCSWQDDVKVRGPGGAAASPGAEVTRVLAGVPASLQLVAERATPSGSGEANLLPYLVLTEKGEKLEIEVRRVTGSPPPSRWRSPSPCRRCTSWRLAGVGNGSCARLGG